MTRIALLLRGVNVGGVSVRSADLRDCLADAGLDDVRTVLASGNAIVGAADAGAARFAAEAALEARYSRRIRVAAVPLPRLASIVAAYPFAEDEAHTPYVVFPLDEDALEGLESLPTAESEQVRRVGDVLCWSNPLGTSTDSPFAKALPRRTGDRTTTRNLRTLRRILAAG